MKFDVFTRPDGAYLLIPAEDAAARRTAESTHGPLEFCESIDPVDYPLPSVWDVVHAELEVMPFAVLAEVIGRRLMHLDCEDDHAPEQQRRAANA